MLKEIRPQSRHHLPDILITDDFSVTIGSDLYPHTLVGLELLSPRAKAYGARIHKKTGTVSEPQRVLLLPEIKLVGQPHTLITPRAGFRERQKVSLLRQGEKFLVQLTRQVSATASYAQFDFRYIKQVDEVLAQDKSGPMDASYDSLWSNI